VAAIDPASPSGAELILPDTCLSDALGAEEVIDTIDVSLSNELVHLLSEQLYTSPLKAIEELVVNSYDADAEECRVALLLGGTTDDEANQGGAVLHRAKSIRLQNCHQRWWPNFRLAG
jgi:hypothetical protein